MWPGCSTSDRPSTSRTTGSGGDALFRRREFIDLLLAQLDGTAEHDRVRRVLASEAYVRRRAAAGPGDARQP
jgi:hypothetical protein